MHLLFLSKVLIEVQTSKPKATVTWFCPKKKKKNVIYYVINLVTK